MQLDILTPEKNLFSGEATSIKLPGIGGSFELLDNHAPIISALKKGVIKFKHKSGEATIEVKDGFVECLQNKVVVLIGSGKIKA